MALDIFLLSSSQKHDQWNLISNNPTTHTTNLDLYFFQIIKFTEFPIQKTTFLSPWMPPFHKLIGTLIDTKYLCVYTKMSDLILINCDNLNERVIISKNNCTEYAFSTNAKILAVILDDTGGDVVLHSVQYFLDKIYRKNFNKLPISITEIVKTNDENDVTTAGIVNQYGTSGRYNVIKKRLNIVHMEVSRSIL